VKTAVDDMAWRIEKYGHEVDESRMKKVAKMKRLSYLIDVCVNDLYIEEAEKELGFKYVYYPFEFEEVLGDDKVYELKQNETPEDKENNSKILNLSHKIQKEYWEEICSIIKGPDYDAMRDEEDWDKLYDGSDLRAWWD